MVKRFFLYSINRINKGRGHRVRSNAVASSLKIVLFVVGSGVVDVVGCFVGGIVGSVVLPLLILSVLLALKVVAGVI